MNITYKLFLIIICYLSATTANCKSGEIFTNYPQWEKVGLNGKLEMQGLPLGIKPSLKIYMERDKVIRISLRTPLMGEIGRMEIDNEKVLAVNKYNNKYSYISMDKVNELCGMTVNNIQDLIMARVFCIGKSKPDKSMFEYEENNGMTAIIPINKPDYYSYGFVIDNSFNLLCTLCEMQDNLLTINYKYPKTNAFDANIVLQSSGLKFEINLNITEISYLPQQIAPIDLSSKMKQVHPTKLF